MTIDTDSFLHVYSNSFDPTIKFPCSVINCYHKVIFLIQYLYTHSLSDLNWKIEASQLAFSFKIVIVNRLADDRFADAQVIEAVFPFRYAHAVKKCLFK